MKSSLLTLCVIISITASAQNVGINTNTPKATLQVVGAAGTAAAADGIIPPKITRAQLIAKTGYGADQTGAILYVTDLSGTNNAATAEVLQPGNYCFDGSKWKPLSVTGARVSGYVDASVAMTLGNLSVRLPANSSLELKFTNAVYTLGSSVVTEFATLASTSNHLNFQAETWQKYHSFSFNSSAAIQQIFLMNITNNTSYRILLMVGHGFNTNFISIERLN